MCFGDLAADRQAETGVLAKAFRFRPVGIEALENAVDVFGLDARTIVFEVDDAAGTRSPSISTMVAVRSRIATARAEET